MADIYASIKSPKQRAALEYGMRLRYAKCLQSNARSDGLDTFTASELQQIQDISLKAQTRAKATYDETLRQIESSKNSPANLGASEEQRQYNGK